MQANHECLLNIGDSLLVTLGKYLSIYLGVLNCKTWPGCLSFSLFVLNV